MRTGLLFFVLGLAATAAGAQQAGLGMKNPNAPIDVSADNFVADANAKTGTYTGNVVIHQGEIQMRANSVRVNVVDGKPEKVVAQGAVVVDAPSGIATGDAGVYDVNPRIVTLTGHVVLTKEKNVMRGTMLTVNLVTGLATLGGGQDQQGHTGRVQGLFIPRSQPDDKP